MKIPFREIANRITGFEIPVFGGGVSWQPPILDREVASRLLTFLEDKRALYQPYHAEVARYVVDSILQIRERLTSDLEQLDRSSQLAISIAAMRAACRKFLDDVEGTDPYMPVVSHRRAWQNMHERNFFISLGELRAAMGFHIAQIAVRYGIDVEEGLASVLPPSPDRR